MLLPIIAILKDELVKIREQLAALAVFAQSRKCIEALFV